MRGCRVLETPSGAWQLIGFAEQLDAWIAAEAPDEDIRLIVTSWVLSRFDDPYVGVRREPGFANLWFGPVPLTVRADTVVVCTYWVEERSHSVRCDGFATLSTPV